MTESKENQIDIFSDNAYKRESLPNTDALQASILEHAKRTPQIACSAKAASQTGKSGSLFFMFRPAFYSTALASIAIVAVISFFIVDFSDNNIAPEVFSESDLDWQELMLIEDDLLFAQL